MSDVHPVGTPWWRVPVSGVVSSETNELTAEELAALFHTTYEALAPDYGYKTRKDTAVPWGSVPDDNKQLMIAVAQEILNKLRCTTCGSEHLSLLPWEGTIVTPPKEEQRWMV